MRQIKRITGIEGVRQGARARFRVDVNQRLFGLTIFAAVDGVAAAVTDVIGRVRVYVNGIPQWDAPAAYILNRSIREGRTPVVGALPLDFATPFRADKVDDTVTAWNLFGMTSCEVELEILAQADPADVVSIEALREFDLGQTVDSKGNALRQVNKLFTIGKNATAGLNDLDNIPIRDAIQRLTFYSAQLPTRFEVDADGDRKIEADAAQLLELYGKHGHVAVPGSNAVRFDYTERVDDFLAVNKTLNVRFNMPAAAAVDVFVETLAAGFM